MLAKFVGERIRHYRNLRGLTQEQLAEALETQGTYIGRVERGEQNLQLQTLEKIADALHIDVYALFEQSDSFEHPKQEQTIRRTVMLLQEQSLQDQERAFRVLQEMFRR